MATDLPTFAVRGVPDGALPTVLAALALLLVLLALLWRGSRVAWTILLLVTLLAVATQPLDPASWWAFMLSLIGIVLLVLPATRRFVWDSAPKQSSA